MIHIGKTGYYTAQKTGYTIQLRNKETLAAGEKSWDYYVPNNRYEQNTSSQTVQTDIGNGDGQIPTLGRTEKQAVDGLSTVVATGELTTKLLQNEPLANQSLAKTSHGVLGVAGKLLGYTNMANDWATVYNKGADATWADYLKASVSTATAVAKITNPWVMGANIIYGIMDASGNNPIDMIYKNTSNK